MTGEGILALIAIAVPVVLLYAYAFFDLAGRRMGAGRKLSWALAIVLLPGIGVVAYYVMRPIATPDGTNDGGSGVADAVDSLRADWERGELDDLAYRRAKLQLFRV